MTKATNTTSTTGTTTTTTSTTTSYPATQMAFGSNINLTALENYAAQPIPAYITRIHWH